MRLLFSTVPAEPWKQSLALKVVCDCNDVIAELWRANGDIKKNGEYVLWDQQGWDEFRSGRFVGWLRQFDALAVRFGCTTDHGFLLGTTEATVADLTSWALWSTMGRCIPELAKPIDEHAPVLMALCRRLESNNSGLTALREKDEEMYGKSYCGGMIEKSIREVVAGGIDGKGA